MNISCSIGSFSSWLGTMKSRFLIQIFFHTQRGESVKSENEDDDEEEEPGSVLFVKNLNFDTREDSLKQVWQGIFF